MKLAFLSSAVVVILLAKASYGLPMFSSGSGSNGGSPKKTVVFNEKVKIMGEKPSPKTLMRTNALSQTPEHAKALEDYAQRQAYAHGTQDIISELSVDKRKSLFGLKLGAKPPTEKIEKLKLDKASMQNGPLELEKPGPEPPLEE